MGIKNWPQESRRHKRCSFILGWEDPVEEGMATHSSILAWRIPWTEEPGRLWSMELQRDTTEVTEYAHMNNQGLAGWQKPSSLECIRLFGEIQAQTCSAQILEFVIIYIFFSLSPDSSLSTSLVTDCCYSIFPPSIHPSA